MAWTYENASSNTIYVSRVMYALEAAADSWASAHRPLRASQKQVVRGSDWERVVFMVVLQGKPSLSSDGSLLIGAGYLADMQSNGEEEGVGSGGVQVSRPRGSSALLAVVGWLMKIATHGGSAGRPIHECGARHHRLTCTPALPQVTTGRMSPP